MYHYPEIYSYLNEKNKIVVDLALNTQKQYKLVAYYVYENFERQLDDIEASCLNDKNLIIAFEKRIENETQRALVIDKYIKFYGNSPSFDDADYRFYNLISPNIEKMSLMQIESLIENINNNYQVYQRNASYSSNNTIIQKAKIDWNKINLDNYKSFHYNKELLKDNS